MPSYLNEDVPFGAGATIADALAIGYRAILIDDASRGVDLADIERTKQTIISNNGVIVDSDQVHSSILTAQEPQ